MRSSRRVTQRVAPALASLASVLLFATCDFDKISGTPTPITQQEIDRLFSITPADTTIILGGTTTLSIAPGANVNLGGTTQSWTSSNTSVVAINSETGVATGVTIGNAVITARVIAPELDTGYSKTRALRVRYKGIKACGVAPLCSPSAIDSIAGLNLSRPFSFFGTNNSDTRQTTALTGVTVTTRDSGATTNTVVAVTGSNVFARRNGAAYVIGVFESMRDSIKVRVRQVAKSLTFPTTDYVANAINANRTHPITMRDVNDSVMTASPRLRWRSSDTTVFIIDSVTGVLRVKKNDTASVFVSVDTILNRRQTLRVRQAIASLTKFAGDITSDTVGRFVTTAPTVTVVDSGNTAIPGDTVIFRVGSGAGVITDSVKLTDANGRAAVGSWRLGPVAGTQTLVATSGPRTTTFTVTGIPQRPFRLGFLQQPSSAATGTRISPAVKVVVRDSLNNLVNTATDSVFIAIGNNPAAATLSGRQRAAAVAGIATFDSLSLNVGGSGFTLVATGAGALESAVSNAFDAFGSATKLAVIRQPVGTSAGAILDSIQIAVQDAAGNVVANDTRNVTLTIGTNPAAGTLTGTTTVAAVNGIATFTGLSINAAGNNYTLTANSTPALTAATTNSFNISVVGPAAKLAFTTQPGNVVSGATPTLAVTVQDANGATVASSGASVTLTLVAGNNTGTLSGITTRTASNGVATFPGISIDKVGTGYKLSATSGSLTPAESNPFNVTPGAANRLGFINQPTHTPAGTVMAPAVTVAVQDANGNTVTGGAATAVTLTLGGCTSATNSGLGPVNSSNGIATFATINIGATVNGCTLTANATGLTSATSTSFNSVAATGAIRLVFGTQPSSTTAGSNLSAFTVRVVDQNGATVTSANPFITLSVLSGPGTPFQGNSTTASSGVATFSVFQLRTAGTYKLLATASGFKADSSVAFTISPSSLFRVAFVNQPTSITAGSAFDPPVSAAFQDQYFNTIVSATGNIDIAFGSNPGGSPLVGQTSVAAVDGVATFGNLTVNKAASGYTLTVFQTGSSLFGQNSNSFNVIPGPVSKVTFSGEPSSVTAGTSFSVTATATDAGGNTITTFSNPISLGLTGGDPTGVLKGTTTVTPINGVASFSGLTIEKAATAYKFTASASGINTTTSANSFNVVAAAATKLGWIDQPSGAIQRGPLHATTTPRVAAQDQFGNTASSFCCTIQIQIGTNPGGVGLLNNGSTFTQVNLSTSGGVGTLTNVSLSGSGTGVTLNATTPFNTPALTAAASQPFNLAAHGAATKLAFVQQPTNGSYAVALSPAVTVAIRDAYDNTVSTATDTITLAKSADPSAGAATLSGGGPTAAVAGIATFANLYLDRPNSGSSTLNGYSLQATASGLTSSTSSTFSVSSPGFVASVSNIADMTRIGDRLYWIEFGASTSLKSVSTTGGPVTTHPGTVMANATRIGTNGTDIFWIEGGSDPTNGTGSVRRFNVGAGTVTTLVSGLYDVRSDANTFAVESGHVYFHSRSADGLTASIRRVATNVLGPTTPTNVALRSPNNTFATLYFTVAGGSVYYFDNQTVTIKRVASDGSGTHVTIANAGGTVQRLVLASNNTLYFSEGTNVRVLAGANTLAAPGTIGAGVSGLGVVYNMIVEGNSMYLKTGTSVVRYNITDFGGTAPQTSLASNGLQDYETLILDGTHIYWSTNSSGIGKILK